MQQESNRNTTLINAFMNGFLDKRKIPYMEINKAHAICRTIIENRLSENSDIKKLIGDNDFVKDLLINCTLLKIHFHGVLGEIEDSEKNNTKIQRPHYF